MTEKRQDKGGTERLGSHHMTLEMAVTQLQKDLDDCRTEFEITRKLTPNDRTFRRLRLPRKDVSAEGDDSYIFPGINSAAVKLKNLTFRRLRLPRSDVSAERDMNYVNVSARREKIDGSRNVDSAAAELNDLFCRRLWLSTAAYHDFAPHSFSAGRFCRRAKW